nr:hypothetical protein [Tanacetum cinerariifolium]
MDAAQHEITAARVSEVINEAKDKLEKRMEELTLRLQLKKRLRVNILDCSHLIVYNDFQSQAHNCHFNSSTETKLEELKEQETAKL